MLKEHSVYINVGDENDEIQISRILNENRINLLRSVKLVNNYRLQLNFVKLESGNRIYDLMYAPTSPKRVLQVSKRKHFDVYQHIKRILEHEDYPQSARKYIKHKTWRVLAMIELPNRWLVFMV